jgi:hypothetical protein
MAEVLTTYHSVRNRMRTGDLLQWRSDSLIGAAIRWRTGANVNHSGLILELKEYEDPFCSRRWTSEALAHGVYPVLLSRRLERFTGQVWWHPLKDDSLRIGIGRRMVECFGIGYDYSSIFRQIFGRVSTDIKNLFCSEYCYHCVGGEGEAPNPGNLISVTGLWEEEGVQIC